MNVLMVEDLSPLAAGTARTLRDSGVHVRCCRDTMVGFACRALQGGECPLESGPVDAAVAVRAGGDAITTFGENRGQAPDLSEEGIVCAIRRHVPLVMVCDTGDPWGGPFDQWIDAACVHDEVAAEVEGVVDGRSETYSAIATKALGEALRIYSIDDRGSAASVIRKEGRLRVSVDLPQEVGGDVRDGCTIKVHDALHAFDPWISAIDVSAG